MDKKIFKKFFEKRRFMRKKVNHLVSEYIYTKKEAKKKAEAFWKAKQTQ